MTPSYESWNEYPQLYCRRAVAAQRSSSDTRTVVLARRSDATSYDGGCCLVRGSSGGVLLAAQGRSLRPVRRDARGAVNAGPGVQPKQVLPGLRW
jgi:hypothetical protein